MVWDAGFAHNIKNACIDGVVACVGLPIFRDDAFWR